MVWLANHAASYVLVCVNWVPLQDGLSDKTCRSDGAQEAGPKLEAHLNDEADAKEGALHHATGIAEDEDNVVSEEEEEENEEESDEDDDADEEDAAAHLHLKLTSKERTKIWS